MEIKNKTFSILLHRLHCYMVEEHEYDDVFIKFRGKKIWPQDKKQQPVMIDTTTPLDVELKDIKKGEKVVIELWDWDLLSPNDKLGTFTMLIEGEQGEFSTDMSQNPKETKKAKYTIDWELY